MTGKRFTVEEMQNWNKRYKLDKETAKCVIDTFDGGEYWTVHGNEAYNLCIDMNALSDENEQLKQQVAFLEEFLKSGVQYEYYQKVYEENEQLKERIEFIFKQIKAFREDCRTYQDFDGASTITQLIKILDVIK